VLKRKFAITLHNLHDAACLRDFISDVRLNKLKSAHRFIEHKYTYVLRNFASSFVCSFIEQLQIPLLTDLMNKEIMSNAES
jgi:hypothetical protein